MQGLEKVFIDSSVYTQSFYFKNNIEVNKPTLVFIHGFAESSFIWENIYPTFLNDCNVIVPELPGSGISNMASTTGDLFFLANYVYEILQAEGLEQCLLLGHSMGGYIAMEMLHAWPNSFKGIGLIHSSAFADLPEKKEARAKAIELIKNGGKDKFYYNLVRGMYNKNFKNEIHLKRHYEIAKEISTEWTVAYYAAMMNRDDRSNDLKTFNGNALIVIGKEDTSIPYGLALKMSYLCNNTLVEVIENCGHFSMFEHPVFLTNIIHKFVFEPKT